MVGRAWANSTRDETSDGPGPIRMRAGGWKLFNGRNLQNVVMGGCAHNGVKP
jgi:hypothetical protein